MELIRNNKGGEKLCHDGYMYTKKSVSATTKRWECAQRKAFNNCKGKIVTNLEATEPVSVIEHNHEPDAGMIEYTKLRHLYANKSRGATKRAVTDMLDTFTADGRVSICIIIQRMIF